MFNRLSKIMLLYSAVLVLSCACGASKEADTSSEQTESKESEEIPEQGESEETPEQEGSEESQEQTGSGKTLEAPESEEASLFEDMSRYSYYFSSGVGGWGTEMTINPDGSFEGSYHDSEMGDTGEGYPNGTVYQCDFTGRFSEPVFVDEYTYTTTVDEISYAKEPEEEEIADDGIRYVYSGAYGLVDADTIYIYIPGKPFSDIPEGYMWWYNATAGYGSSDEDDGSGMLEAYGIYNEKADCGFTSVQEQFGKEELIELYHANLEKQNKIDYRLENEDMDQFTMNSLSYDEYGMWDSLINDIWSYLRENLDEEEFAALKEEQRSWIKDKEEEVSKAGAQYEGGSIQPMIENETGAEITRKRVEVLLRKYLQL